MADTKKSEKADARATTAVENAHKKPQPDSLRETMESIAIAFVLAFLFKTFQAEIYVIPTGSMAPTLLGRHKDAHCDGCGYDFTVGASSELDQSDGVLVTDQRILGAVCPNCRYRIEIEHAPAYNGDRILVNKQVSEYRRFDVVVFKNPEEGHINYIKRLVGLPGETIRILAGNIWSRPNDDDTARWQIQRKQDPAVQKDIQLLVYDDHYPPREMLAAGFPERWVPAQYSESARQFGGWPESENAWTADREARTYSADSSTDWQWLRYRHVVPAPYDWDDVENGRELRNAAAATLVTDFCGFNTARTGDSDGKLRGANRNYSEDVYWVGDLTLCATIDVAAAETNGAVMLELVEGPRRFRCEFNLTSGEVRLLNIGLANRRSDEPNLMASASTPVKGTGKWDVRFANVDDRVLLWIDDELVEFDAPTTYEDAHAGAPIATLEDLAPCGIAARSAELEVSRLLLQRDIYYRNETYPFATADEVPVVDDPRFLQHISEVRDEGALRNSLADPSKWSENYLETSGIQQERYSRFMEFRLDEGEYLMFGDNSPKSKDSRLFDLNSRPMAGVFSHRYAVREQDLIGRALFIFWPHGIPFLNDGKGFAVLHHKEKNTQRFSNEKVRIVRMKDYPSVRFPFYPNFGRMKKIR
ncbi:MAG: S26 family signal peptidase [Planctomycetaceae bacterium]